MTPLLLLGFGQVAEEILRQSPSREVHATTRAADRCSDIEAAGARPWRLPCERLPAGADVVVSFPPDGRSDALLGSQLQSPRHIVYVSSTAVYGSQSGTIDHTTKPRADSDRGRRRLDAEAYWASLGARILRVPAIYGPERGVHVRIKAGTHKLTGDGTRRISRIHVYDLAALCLAALKVGEPGAIYLVGDLRPCTQREIVDYVVGKTGAPPPPSVPLDQASPTLQGDRAIDPKAALKALSVTLRYPDYEAGLKDVL